MLYRKYVIDHNKYKKSYCLKCIETINKHTSLHLTYVRQTFLYVVSLCVDILKVHIFNPNKNMQRVFFVQASRVNGTKYRWNKVSNIGSSVLVLLIWIRT